MKDYSPLTLFLLGITAVRTYSLFVILDIRAAGGAVSSPFNDLAVLSALLRGTSDEDRAGGA
jgi:hypothetical protein